jgi:hypothetical protein
MAFIERLRSDDAATTFWHWTLDEAVSKTDLANAVMTRTGTAQS